MKTKPKTENWEELLNKSIGSEINYLMSLVLKNEDDSDVLLNLGMKAEKAKKRIIQHCNMAIQQARQEGIEEAINITGDILIKYQGLYDESPTINEALNRVISELKKKGIK